MKVFGTLGHSPLEIGGSSPSVDAQVLEIPGSVALVDRCLAGESPAWRELYEAHFDFVYRVARRLGTPPEELDDVCQEVFLVAFRKLDDFRTGRLTTWLYRICANVASQRHRRRRVRRAFQGLWGGAEEPVMERTPHRELESRQVEVLVGRVLEGMAPKKREVFVLYELDGMSGDAIAELVGCKVETVWTRLHYARKEFAQLARKRGLEEWTA
jgi:RNA polymerase sigma-70 factor (ECF subfamily)